MKKFIAIVLSCCMVFAFAACSQLNKLENLELPPLPTQLPTATPQPTPEPTEMPIEIIKAEATKQIIINTIRTSLEAFDPAEGKELILSFSYDTPVVYIEGADEVAEKINQAIALMDETYYTGNDHGVGEGIGGYNMMLEQAVDNYGFVVNTGAQGVSLEFIASRTADVKRADSALLSLVYSDYYYTGGAHGTYFSRGYCFDIDSGDQLSIEQLAENGEEFKNYLVDTMVTMAENDDSISARIQDEIVPTENRAEAFKGLLRDGSWYFTNEGICIFSDVYEFGPYAAGEVKFNIPYEKLSGKILDKYMPETRSGKAELGISYLDDTQNGSVEIIDRVVIREDGDEICLSIKGTAYDVNLISVDYVDRFFETQQHWYANIVEDSALQVLTVVPEGMPNLMLSFMDAEGVNHRALISQSGVDGKLQLVDDSIQAVG